jgi:hypothetical protein
MIDEKCIGSFYPNYNKKAAVTPAKFEFLHAFFAYKRVLLVTALISLSS